MKKILKCFITALFAAVLSTACTNAPEESETPEKKKTPVEKSNASIQITAIGQSYVTECNPETIHANGLLDRNILAAGNVPWECDYYTWVKLGQGTQVDISCDDPEADIYYTLDGSTPTTNSNKYTGPFEIPTISKLRIKAFNSEANTVSIDTSLDITAPFGTSKVTSINIGNGKSETYVIFEALADKSGPDFSKQHYILKIDDGNRIGGDGIPANGALSFDSRLDPNFYEQLGENFNFNNDYCEATGRFRGTLWTKDIFKVDQLSQPSYTPRPGQWHDTIYKAGFLYQVTPDEHMIDEDKAETGYNIYQTASNCYAYPSEEYERCTAKYIREDTNQDPPVAYFSLIALAGYFYNESNGHFEKLPSDIRGFELYNKENYMFKWYTDDYSN